MTTAVRIARWAGLVARDWTVREMARELAKAGLLRVAPPADPRVAALKGAIGK